MKAIGGICHILRLSATPPGQIDLDYAAKILARRDDTALFVPMLGAHLGAWIYTDIYQYRVASC